MTEGNWLGVEQSVIDLLVATLEARRDRRPKDVSTDTMNAAIDVVKTGVVKTGGVADSRHRRSERDLRPNRDRSYAPSIGDVVRHSTAGVGWVVNGISGETVFLRRGHGEYKYVSVECLTLSKMREETD